MTLTPGTRLGPYEIEAPLGSGGMGEVYRALDVRLQRPVALKVLRTSVSQDPDHLRRFEQEARTAGAISHPSIVAIHDIGVQDGVPYLVSELLEGETLRARLASGPLPVRRAVEYAVQLARGLAAAHDRGIVHRDLKPENILLTTGGLAKILDFGLAKLRPEAMPAQAAGGAETIAPTTPGLVLGTIGYMSPEQVKGQAVDARSDIFSLGLILYEMVTGRRAFVGDSPAETLSAILRNEPTPVSELNTQIPEAIDRIVHHCLEKNPDDRFHSARDLAFSLEALSISSGQTRGMPETAARRRKLVAPAVVVGLAAVVLAGAAYLVGRSGLLGQEPPAEPVRVHRLTDIEGLEESPALAPDGRSVAFVALAGGHRQVWVQLMARGTALQITRAPQHHLFPRWAPDSSSLLVYSPPGEGQAMGTLSEISALGGLPRRVASSISGGDISPDGTRIAFFRTENQQTELVVSSRDGSQVTPVLGVEPDYIYSLPRWSPDGRRIAYQRGTVFRYDVFAVPAAGGTPVRLTSESTILRGFAWMADGDGIVLSSARGTTVFYLPTFNLWHAQPGKLPRQLTFGEASYVEPDVGRDGHIVASRLGLSSDIWEYPTTASPAENTRQGRRITRQTGHVQTPSVSPDGREIVYLSDSGGHGNLWVIDLTSGERRQLTFERDPQVILGVPVWSPDGRYIAFFSNRDSAEGSQGGNWLVRPDGSDLRQVTIDGGWATWSPDGRWLYAFQTRPPAQLLKLPVDGGEPVVLRTDNATRPAVGPDGQTLYFVRDRLMTDGGTEHEIVAASPEDGAVRELARISPERVPFWQLLHPVLSPDGQWLAMPLTDGVTTNLWALSTTTGEFRQLTDFERRATFITRRLSWAPDGRSLFAAVADGDADIVGLEGLR